MAYVTFTSFNEIKRFYWYSDITSSSNTRISLTFSEFNNISPPRLSSLYETRIYWTTSFTVVRNDCLLFFKKVGANIYHMKLFETSAIFYLNPNNVNSTALSIGYLTEIRVRSRWTFNHFFLHFLETEYSFSFLIAMYSQQQVQNYFFT